MKKFAVFGNPIKHSKSPLIHKLFAKQVGINKNFYYSKKLIPLNKFKNKVNEFFLNKGLGINVTLPFKKEAFFISDKLTKKAKISKSVNTLKFENGYLLGDNTDGIGLIKDLKRLNMVNIKDKILIIGAGGAAQGIIPNLLSLSCDIFIINRTLENAINLSNLFNSYQNIKVLNFNNIEKYKFNLIINASSGSVLNDDKKILSNKIFIDEFTNCYDISYVNKGITPFLNHCKIRKAKKISDGIGMLVFQAAYSFLLWNKILPDAIPIIKFLNNIYK